MSGIYLPLNQNKVQKRDIHTRKELWQQKIRLFDLKKFDKDFWDSSYNFLPLPKTYNRIQKKVKDWIEKNKDCESQYLELQKQLGEILIELAQKEKTEKKELKRIALALSKHNWEQIEKINQEKIKNSRINELVEEYKKIKEELREPCYIIYHENNVLQFTYHNIRGVDFGLTNYGFLYRNKLYFISKHSYIDNAKLYCRVEAYVDKIYLYYGNYLRSMGTIKLNRAPLFLEKTENPLAESNKLHYSFCNDKGNLVLKEINNANIQPRISTFVLDLKKEVDTSHITMFKAGQNSWDPELPNQLNITDMSSIGGVMNWLSGFVKSATGDQTLAFLAPAEKGNTKNYFSDGSIQYIDYSNYDNQGKPAPDEISIPEEFVKYPHLIHESTVQVFFMNKLIHTGFLNQFWLEERGGTNADGHNTDKYIVLKFLNQIRANPSGIYYLMHSKTQFWKAELSVSQVFKTQTFMQSVRSGIMSYFTKNADLLDVIGLNNTAPNDFVENEESTRRIFKNPSKGGNKNKPLITPDLLYPNTVDLKYDFLEFANRYSYPYLVFRFQFSKDLLNNLHNSNNKSHELNLDLKFNSLGAIINKPGNFQGSLKLKNDSDGIMSEILENGVFFYENLDKDLTNPDLKLQSISNDPVIPISNASIFVGDETIESQTFTHKISYQADKREYSHATWFCFSDGEEQDRFHSLSCSLDAHYTNNAPNTTKTGFCWGCTYDELVRNNFLAVPFTPSKDCDFVYCLEAGNTPTTRKLQGGTDYLFTFTNTDILISWTVYKRNTEKVEVPTIDPDNLRETAQSDQAEEIPDLSDLEEDDGENEEKDDHEDQEESEESASESSDDEEYQESSSEESSSESSEDESEESEESEESDDEDTDDYQSSEEE